MIDSLTHYRVKSTGLSTYQSMGLISKNFILLTMHRPANVDTTGGLSSILRIIERAAIHLPIVFSIHPRTRKHGNGLLQRLQKNDNLLLTEPQGYMEFLQLMDNATLIITDSGGIQEETTYLQVRCLTFRDSTERHITVELGTINCYQTLILIRFTKN